MSVQSIIVQGRRLQRVGPAAVGVRQLHKRTQVRDSTGGKKDTWVPRADGVGAACRFVALSDEDPVINLDSVFGRPEATLLLPLGVTFAEGDRVQNLVDDSWWLIVATLTPPSNLAIVGRAAIKKVQV